MARRVFYSFHFTPGDVFRVQQIRNMGVLDGNVPVTANSWEEVKRRGKQAIRDWIDKQMATRSCVVVWIGAQTSTREWVKYEIRRGWELNKGVVGVYIHNLKDSDRRQSTKGHSPFWGLHAAGTALYSVVKAYDPPFSRSTSVYDHIRTHLSDWVEEAIEIRRAHGWRSGMRDP